MTFTQGAHCGLDWDLHPESKLVCAEIIEGVRKTSSHPFRDTVPPFTPLTFSFAYEILACTVNVFSALLCT